ncbi:MAG: FxsA family protein [Planctomycetaceae bacterium]|jgi:UPF0716 protein FxsA|nr:FxsA family protein [Planctomycetaceae bacterium]
MFYWKIVLLFLFIPVIELAGLWVLLFVFKFYYGVLIIFGIGVVGIFLAKRQGMTCWLEFNRQVENGEVPKFPVMNGMLIFIAAVLLVLPGILSDFFGILLLIPFVRAVIIDHFVLRFEEYRNKTKNGLKTNNYGGTSDDVIDVS